MSRRAWLIAGVVFAIALVALMPLRVALALMPPMLTARAASGSLWSGQLVEARIGPLLLGDVAAALDPLALLTGRLRFDLAGRVPAFEARIAAGPGGLALDSATGRIVLAGGTGLPPVEAVELDGIGLEIVGGRCTAARGRVTAELPAAVAGLAAGAALRLSGPVSCAGGELRLELASAGGTERLTARLGPARWTARLRVSGENRPVLELSGDY